VPSLAWAVPSLETKQQKGANHRARSCAGTHGPCQALWKMVLFLKLGGTATPLSGTAMPDIFAHDLHILVFNQLQNPFLLLQDSIFHIFVLEIK